MRNAEVEKIIKAALNKNCALATYERLVFCAIAVHGLETGECSPTNSDLAQSCNISIRQARRITSRLKLCGAISITGKRKTKTGACNVYRLSVEAITSDRASR